MRWFEFERLTVYRHSLDLADLSDDIAAGFPPRRRDLADQLLRASASVVLNIAEGAGETAPAEKRRFYRMARRSAMETAAILALAARKKLVGEEWHRSAREMLFHVVNLLTVMTRKPASRPPESA